MREDTTWLSLVAENSRPKGRSFSRRDRALVTLPLWAVAMRPVRYSVTKGWTFSRVLAPVVEYRAWPMACPAAGSPARAAGGKASLTSPSPFWQARAFPLAAAMPAPSWPRCCRANSPL